MRKQRKSEFWGIRTHNLKSLDIGIDHGAVYLVTGPSGSGKSSLVEDTIYQISKQEFDRLEGSEEVSSEYDLEAYENILPSILLAQRNSNRNPLSTIGSYFGFHNLIARTFSRDTGRPIHEFSLTNIKSRCSSCSGTGVAYTPDLSSIIDENRTVKQMPFRIWDGNERDLKQQLLCWFAEQQGIPLEVPFCRLKTTQKQILLNGTSKKKTRIRYRSGSRTRIKTALYLGPLEEFKDVSNKAEIRESASKFFRRLPCPACKGQRFAPEICCIHLGGMDFGNLWTAELFELSDWLDAYLLKKDQKDLLDLKGPLQHFLHFLQICILLSLSHLSLGRSIPTLSGGELQRLRIAKILTGTFIGLLYILDEPAASLHPVEIERMKELVKELHTKGNTAIIVSHDNSFANIANKVITLGPGAGELGGHLIKSLKTCPPVSIDHIAPDTYTEINEINYRHLNIPKLRIPNGCLTGICGASGSGKTTLLSEVLGKQFPNSKFFSQLPLLGNAYSTVATYLGISGHLAKAFAKSTKQDKDMFFFSSSSQGACKACKGKGVAVEIDVTGIQRRQKCPVCSGSRFNLKALSFKVDGMSILDAHQRSVVDLSRHEVLGSNQINRIAGALESVGLGYLSSMQETSSLSGGESQRLRLAKMFSGTRFKQNVLLLDEPCRGLSDGDLDTVMQRLHNFALAGGTVVISEHNSRALMYCSYIVELGPGAGMHGGSIIFQGLYKEIFKSRNSIIKPFLKPSGS